MIMANNKHKATPILKNSFCFKFKSFEFILN